MKSIDCVNFDKPPSRFFLEKANSGMQFIGKTWQLPRRVKYLRITRWGLTVSSVTSTLCDLKQHWGFIGRIKILYGVLIITRAAITLRWRHNGAMASQITSLTIVYSIVYSGADQRKHQSSTSLAFVRGIHRWPVNSLHKWPVTRRMFPFDDVIMTLNHTLFNNEKDRPWI